MSPHPDWEPTEDWPQEVPVVRYETEDEVVLIDPFLPPEGVFDPHGKPVRVLLTQGAHYRGTADFVERFGASVWTPPRAVWRKIPNPATTERTAAGRRGDRARRRAAAGRLLHPRALHARRRRRAQRDERPAARLHRRGRPRAAAARARSARRAPDRARDHPARRRDRRGGRGPHSRCCCRGPARARPGDLPTARSRGVSLSAIAPES